MGVEIWGLTLSGSGETAARAMPVRASPSGSPRFGRELSLESMVDEKGIARNWHIDAKALPIRRDSISQIAQIHIEDLKGTIHLSVKPRR